MVGNGIARPIVPRPYELTAPYPSAETKMWLIGSNVGRVKNDGPDIFAPSILIRSQARSNQGGLELDVTEVVKRLMSTNKTIREIRAEVHGVGGYRVLNTVADLADCLLYRWPVTDGDAFIIALETCHNVLDGHGDPSEARAAFVAAAREAGVSVMPDDAG